MGVDFFFVFWEQNAPTLYKIALCVYLFCFPVHIQGSLHQNASDKNWRNRRSQKLDKMELLNLQSSLQSEIQAKAAISEELSRTRADLVAAQKYISLSFPYIHSSRSYFAFVTFESFDLLLSGICESLVSVTIRLVAI